MSPKTFFSITLSGPDAWRKTVFLESGIVSVGSQSSADIRHVEMAVDAVELHFEKGEWVLYQINPNVSMLFRGEAIRSKKPNPGDRVQIDDFTLEFDSSHRRTETPETDLYEQAPGAISSWRRLLMRLLSSPAGRLSDDDTGESGNDSSFLLI